MTGKSNPIVRGMPGIEIIMNKSVIGTAMMATETPSPIIVRPPANRSNVI